MSKIGSTDHPECRKGEVFLTNKSPEDTSSVNYLSIRVGIKAYNSNGSLIPGLVPIFVSKEEYEHTGLTW